MKAKMQVVLHRKHHDGSVIVRLEPVEDSTIPVAQRLRFHQVIEVHADSDETLAGLKGPTDEVCGTTVKSVVINGTTQTLVDRVVTTPAVPGAQVYLTLSPAS